MAVPEGPGAGCGLTGCSSLAGPSRSLCAGEVPSLSYQELKDLKKTKVLHVDVRERWEIDKFGKIPASVNIPRKSRCSPVLDGHACEQKWQGLSEEELC